MIELVRIAALLVVTLAYAIFDVFNNRNVPNVFAYATVAIGLLITLTYPVPTIEYSLLIAAVIFGIGYLTYKAGMLGGGDLFEFLFISLVMPMQLVPLLTSTPQFSLPFMLSVFITTGYATILTMPFYYIAKGRAKMNGRKLEIPLHRKIAGAVIFMIYVLLIAFTSYEINYGILGVLLLLLAAVPSAMIIIYEGYIYRGMARDVYPKELEEGDMVAINMMSKSEIAFFKGKSRRFGRLVDKKLLMEIRNVRRKLPVYKDAIPLALFTFIGVIVSLVAGNLILLIFF